MKLSSSQYDALADLRNLGPADHVAVLCRGQKVVTFRALERRGFVRYFPYGGPKRQGVWRITREGQVELTNFEREVLAQRFAQERLNLLNRWQEAVMQKAEKETDDHA